MFNKSITFIILWDYPHLLKFWITLTCPCFYLSPSIKRLPGPWLIDAAFNNCLLLWCCVLLQISYDFFDLQNELRFTACTMSVYYLQITDFKVGFFPINTSINFLTVPCCITASGFIYYNYYNNNNISILY